MTALPVSKRPNVAITQQLSQQVAPSLWLSSATDRDREPVVVVNGIRAAAEKNTRAFTRPIVIADSWADVAPIVIVDLVDKDAIIITDDGAGLDCLYKAGFERCLLNLWAELT